MVEKSKFKVEGDEDEEIGEAEVRGKVNLHRYRTSEKGKVAVKRVNGSGPARESRRRYRKTSKGKLAGDRYRNSPAGRLARERYEEKLKLVALILKREGQGLCGLCGGGEHSSEKHVR